MICFDCQICNFSSVEQAVRECGKMLLCLSSEPWCKRLLMINHFEIVHSPLACEQAPDWVSGWASWVWSRARMVWGRKDPSIHRPTWLAWLAKFFYPPRWVPVCRLILHVFFCITSGRKTAYERVGFHKLDHRKYFSYMCLSKYLKQTHQMSFQVR